MDGIEHQDFEKNPVDANKFRGNANAVSGRDKVKLSYMWVAETGDGEIPQYTVQGKENSFSKVREAADNKDLEAFYLVPLDVDSRDVVGLTSVNSSGFDYFRRGLVKGNLNGLHMEEYTFQVVSNGEKYVVVGPDGSIEIVDDKDFDPTRFK